MLQRPSEGGRQMLKRCDPDKKNMVLKIAGQDIRWMGKAIDLQLGDLGLNPGSMTLLVPVSTFIFFLKM